MAKTHTPQIGETGQARNGNGNYFPVVVSRILDNGNIIVQTTTGRKYQWVIREHPVNRFVWMGASYEKKMETFAVTENDALYPSYLNGSVRFDYDTPEIDAREREAERVTAPLKERIKALQEEIDQDLQEIWDRE